ncbi:integrating conjugative element protein, partial [Escherichia coli]|nr:integrating conjugative element protein [Escherichia coli]
MKQKMTIPVLAVVLCAGTVQADGNFLSLPKVNDSAFGYGKSVDGAVSDKLFYTLGG